MRNFLWIWLLIFMISCGESHTVSGELVGEIESKSAIGDLSAEEYEASWLSVENRKSFLSDWFAKIKNNEFEVFVYIPDTLIPMSDQQLAYLFHHVDTEYVPVSAFKNDTIIYEEVLTSEGVAFLKFKEDLYYDQSTGSVSKKVQYVCPMEKMYNEDGTVRGYKGLFWVKNTK